MYFLVKHTSKERTLTHLGQQAVFYFHFYMNTKEVKSPNYQLIIIHAEAFVPRLNGMKLRKQTLRIRLALLYH